MYSNWIHDDFMMNRLITERIIVYEHFECKENDVKKKTVQFVAYAACKQKT